MSAEEELSEDQEGVIKIPAAKFINDVEEYLAGRNPEEAIKELNSDYSTYKMVEQQLLHKKTRMMTKVPDLKKALEMVKLLIEKDGQEVVVDYSLADQVHATAKLKDVTTVKLWLGADVMLEYELEEARQVLEENLAMAQKSLQINNSNLELMKDFITTVEVSIARIYNHDISARRQRDKPAEKPS